MPKQPMKTTSQDQNPSVKWYVWKNIWFNGYIVLLHGTEYNCVGWEFTDNTRFTKIEGPHFTKSWHPVFRIPKTDFAEISEEEALKILVGGPQYGLSKFSQTYGLSGVS